MQEQPPPSRLSAYAKRNVFAIIFLLNSLVLLGLLLYKSSQLGDAQFRLDQMQQEAGRLQDQKMHITEDMAETEKKLAECRQKEQLHKGLPEFGQ